MFNLKLTSHKETIKVVTFGDSVTEGCFECFLNNDGTLNTVTEHEHSYSKRLSELFKTLYPSIKFNIINKGISGDSTRKALLRFDNDVISANPDLVIISFGLNDTLSVPIDEYLASLEIMFKKLNDMNIPFIFLSENMMCKEPFIDQQNPITTRLSKQFSDIQNSGKLKRYFTEAMNLSKRLGGRVCDIYSDWEKMAKSGINTDTLLSNKLNHPLREYHYYIATKLLKIIVEE